MPSHITLDANENAKVENAIPTSSNSNRVYHSAHARIYYDYTGTKKWSYSGLQGALVFVVNASSNTPHFKMVDLDGTGGVIWAYELHDEVVLEQEKNATFFLSFESDFGGEKRTIGFVFLDDSDAQIFCNHVKNNKATKSVPAKPKGSSWMKAAFKGNSIDKSTTSHPKESGFMHVAHMGYDADSGFNEKRQNKVDAIAKAWGNHQPKPFEEFSAGGGTGEADDGIRQPIFVWETADLEPPTDFSPATSPVFPKRSKSLMSRIRQMRDAPYVPIAPNYEQQLPHFPSSPADLVNTSRPTQRSKGVDPSWSTVLENYSGRQQNQPVIASRPRPPPPPHSAQPISGHFPSSRLAVPSRDLVAPYTPISPVVEEGQLPPPPPRRSTPLIHGLPPPPVRSFPPQPPEMETNPTTIGIHSFRSRYSKTPSPVLSHSISRNTSISPTIVPSRFASSMNSADMIQQQESHESQRPSHTYEAIDEDDAESLPPDANQWQTQTAQLPPQRSQHDTAPWILASRTPHAPKKPVDTRFIAYMAGLRRQINDSDASSTGSAPRVSLIIPRVSVSSSAFSESLSVASAPRVVEFPPTPIFKDEVPEGILRNNSRSLSSSVSGGFVNRT